MKRMSKNEAGILGPAGPVFLLALAMLVAGLAVPAGAAVTTISTPTSGTVTAATLTFSHDNPGGTDTMIIVGVAWDGRNGEAVSSVTYAGQALTCGAQYGVSDNRGSAAICYRAAPATGNNDVVVTMTSNGGKPVVAGAVVVSGADQAAPTEYGAGGTNTTATLSGISASGTDMVIGVIGGYKADTSIAPNGGETELWEDGVSGTEMGSMTYKMGASSLSWSNATNSSQWGIAALVISEGVSCTETQTVTVDEPVPDPITGATTISATGSGGASNVQVSDDNATWHNSPWTYTPPSNSTGTVTFYARATGDCGTISDPTPVTVSYDTTCNPTGSIAWNGTSTAAGDFSCSSLLTLSNVTNLECQVDDIGGGGCVGDGDYLNTNSDELKIYDIDTGAAGTNFSVGTRIRFEFRTQTRFSDATQAFKLKTCLTKTDVYKDVAMNETQQGSDWVYTFDWDSSGASETCYNTEIKDKGDNIPKAAAHVTLGGSPGGDIQFFSDSGLSTPADSFKDGDTVYVKVWLDCSESSPNQLQLGNWYNTNYNPSATVDAPGNPIAFHFTVDFNSAGVSDGDWGWLKYKSNCNGNFEIQRPIKRDDAGCSGGGGTLIAWNADPQEATGVLSDGNQYRVYARGTDATCGTRIFAGGTADPGDPQTITWSACTETASVTLGAIPDPITGATTITATGSGGAANILVGDTNPPTHASGWVYDPPVDATGTVTFYAQADGVCGGVVTDSVTVSYDTVVPPTVTSTTPADNATGVIRDSSVTIDFSEAVDCATVTTSTVTISGGVGWSRTGCSGSQAVFAPSGQGYSTTYTVTVTTGVTDANGIAMASPYTFSYTTEAAVCTRSAPSISITTADQTITSSGGSAVYSVSITNNDSVACGDTSFNLTANNTNSSDFSASIGSPLVLSPGGATNVNLTVTHVSAATGASTINSVTIGSANHSNVTSNSRTTSVSICNSAAPTVSFTPTGSTITSDGGSTVYTVTVTNNDSGAGCSASTFTLGVSDSNTTDFAASTLSAGSVSVSPGASDNSVTLTVTALAGANNVANDSTVTADAAGHAQGSGVVTTNVQTGLKWQITACYDCHETPPLDAVDGPDADTEPERNNPTGAVVGSHGAHSPLTCDNCHVEPAAPDAWDHSDGTIDMANPLRGGAYSRGDAIPQDYNVTPADLGDCSTSDCHNAGTAPTWGTDLSGTPQCEKCHGQPPAQGAHERHMTNNQWGPPGMISDCDTCHIKPSGIVWDGSDGHMDPNSGVEQHCSTTQCHDKGLADATMPNPAWTGGPADCTWCHGNPPASIPDHAGQSAKPCTDCHSHAGTGNPADHLNGSVTYPNASCSSCHSQPPAGSSFPNTDKSHTAHFNQTIAKSGLIADCDNPACHSKPTAMNHANGTVEQSCSTSLCHDTGLAGASNPNPTWGAGNADCTWCHGNPPNIPDHTGVGTGNCNACHSHNASGNPAGHIDGAVTYPNATCTSCHNQPPDGTTSPNVNGSHTAHFGTGFTTNITDCDSPACHAKPTAMNHANGTVEQSCDTGLCHDSAAITSSAKTDAAFKPNPAWGVDSGATCEWCHDNPPLNSTKRAHATNETQCDGCHPHAGTSAPEHMDGILQASGGDCDSCHAYPPDPNDGMTGAGGYTPHIEGKGAHVKHVNNIYQRDTSLQALDPTTDQFGDAKVTAVCGTCHDLSVGHMTGIHILPADSTRFPPTGAGDPTYNGVVDQSSTVSPKSCSNVKCHFQDSPVWQQP